eukprot:1071945-Amphidinium_carterae.2
MVGGTGRSEVTQFPSSVRPQSRIGLGAQARMGLGTRGYDPQANGTAERAVEMVKTLVLRSLTHSKLPREFWSFAALYAAQSLPCKALQRNQRSPPFGSTVKPATHIGAKSGIEGRLLFWDHLFSRSGTGNHYVDTAGCPIPCPPELSAEVVAPDDWVAPPIEEDVRIPPQVEPLELDHLDNTGLNQVVEDDLIILAAATMDETPEKWISGFTKRDRYPHLEQNHFFSHPSGPRCPQVEVNFEQDTYGIPATPEMDACIMRYLLSWHASRCTPSVTTGSHDDQKVLSSLDHTGAFLNAELPEGRTIVLRPPAIFVWLGVIKPNTYWLLHKALYGLRESPMLWGATRDKGFTAARNAPHHLHSSTHPWSYCCGVFVDDLLKTDNQGLLNAVITRIRKLWKAGDPEFLTPQKSLFFLGVRVEHHEDGLHIHQQSYTKELLKKFRYTKGIRSRTTIAAPERFGQTPPVPPDHANHEHNQKIQYGQQVLGGRFDLSYSVSTAAGVLTKDLTEFDQRLTHLLAYLVGNPNLGPIFRFPKMRSKIPISPNMTTFSDASLSPGGGRSQSGFIVQLTHNAANRNCYTGSQADRR